ncbi:hypothetical protein M0811_04239 [Anaeramoeba ignava]|uniref:Uncharacterized protein n=1 Tax=Anaeramoeba ignava TaxID=1746090 RepID=A0A9Q0LUD7_ANAIG|nr:hypothetical protein M0811_04239 [Anaeramoeba ignava]
MSNKEKKKNKEEIITLSGNVVEEVLKANMNITLKNQALFDILQQTEKKTPTNDFLIKEAIYSGKTMKKKVHFECTYEIEVLAKEKWVSCALQLANVQLEDVQIEEHEEKNDLQSYIGIQGNYYCLITNRAGKHVVKMKFYTKYRTEKKNAVGIWIPNGFVNKVKFCVVNKDVQINVISGFDCLISRKNENTILTCKLGSVGELSVSWTEKDEEALRKQKEEQERAAKDKLKPKQKLIVNCEQFNFHSIGEGYVQSDCTFRYQILHGTKSRFDILVPYNVKVLNVEGRSLKKWKIIERKIRKMDETQENVVLDMKKDEDDSDTETDTVTTTTSTVSHTPSAESAMKKIRVWLEMGVENDYELNFETELEMKSTSAEVAIPVFKNYKIDRDKGWVGIAGRTNVEINEGALGSLAKIDVKELPYEVTSKSTDDKLLLSYKFLFPIYTLRLNVVKHSDIDVLIATIEHAHMRLTYSGSSIMYKCILNVKNTQKQFLRMFVNDPNFELWSTVVSGRATKPSRDKQNFILVPLEKRSANDSMFKVEVVYVINTKTMKGRNRLKLHFPKFDLPINNFEVSLYLPGNFRYSEFWGTLKEDEMVPFEVTLNEFSNEETELFDEPFEQVTNYPMQERHRVRTSRRMPQQVMPQQQMLSNVARRPPRMVQQQMQVSFDSLDAFDSFDLGGLPPPDAISIKNASSRGVDPIIVGDVIVGSLFRFHKLLISPQDPVDHLSVVYSEISKGFFDKRRTSVLPTFFARFLMFLTIIGIFILFLILNISKVSVSEIFPFNPEIKIFILFLILNISENGGHILTFLLIQKDIYFFLILNISKMGVAETFPFNSEMKIFILFLILNISKVSVSEIFPFNSEIIIFILFLILNISEMVVTF